MSKLGDKLNYGSMKSEAAASREITQVIPTRSGTSFVENQTIEFELPSNRPQEFLDMVNNVKIKLPVTLAVAAATLDRGGAYGFIRSIELTQNGVPICDVAKSNVLITALSDFQMSSAYKSTTGRLLEGFEGDCLRGAIMADASSRTFYLSLLATNLAMTTPHRDLYMGSSAPIIVRLTLESHILAYSSVDGTATYTVNLPELHIKTTFIEKAGMDELNSAVKGNYQMLCNTYDHQSHSLAAGTTAAHIKLSFAKASLERIMFVMRPDTVTSTTAGGAGGGAKFSLGGRTTSGIQSYQLSVNGQQYPQVPIRHDPQGADFMYHLLAADNLASNYSQGTGNLVGGLTLGAGLAAAAQTTASLGSNPEIPKANSYMLNGAAALATEVGTGITGAQLGSNIGTFIGAINLEGGLITSGNAPLYSGINTLNGVDLYIDMAFAVGGLACTIDFFALSTELIYLDSQTNLWARRS